MLKTVAITSGGGGGSNGTVTNVATGTGLTGGPITTTGTIALANTTVTAGTYGNASTVAQVTINAQGQATNVVNVAISIANSAVTGLGTMATQNANAVVVTGGSINNTAIGNATANTGVFTTLTNTGTAYLGGASGNQSLQVDNIASAVNYARIVGAVAGSNPTFSVQGTDTNINSAYLSKGTGGHNFSTGGGLQFTVGNIANAVNYLQAQGAPTGSSVGLSVQGVDPSVSIGYFSKGSGYHFFYTNGIPQVSISPTASAVNRVNFTGAATSGAPSVSVTGSDANISLTLSSQGTGIVQTAATLKYAGVIAGLSTKTANYTLVATDYTVLGNATTASFSLTLPTSVGATGQVYIIKKVDSTANTVTITTTSSQTIDGSASKVLSSQYDGFQLQSDGANWIIIGNIFGRNGTTGTF
jgi:hypothetical protein